MGLKIFSKVSQFEGKTQEPSDESQQRVEKLELHLNELGGEVLKLRAEVNTLLARQQNFRSALRRLREFLEVRGSQQENDEIHEEVGASFQDIPSDEAEERPALEVSEIPSSGRSRFKTSLH